MDLYLDFGLILLGFVGLIGGADLLVRGASGIARSLGVPSIVVGLTIVAYGTSMPEFMASFMAMQQGSNGIALGNVLGSNICNIALVLGVAGVLTTIRMEKDVYQKQLPITIILTLIVIAMIFTGNTISRIEGLFLFVGVIIFTVWNFRRNRDGMNTTQTDGDNNIFERNYFAAVGVIIAGCILLYFGGDWVVDGATSIAHRFSVPDRIIGATLIALGTSLPELITTVIGILKGETDLGVGNAVGSCIFNILMVIGGTAVYKPIKASVQEYWLEFLFCLAVTVVLYPMASKTRKLTRTHGFILIAFYLAFIFLVY